MIHERGVMMRYFNEILSPDTYADCAENLHVSNNANSGGGQFFLAGSFRDNNNTLTNANNLRDRIAIFQIEFTDAEQNRHTIQLNDERTQYRIVNRGGVDNNVKLLIQEEENRKENPSNVLAVFFMLPATCGRKNASNLNNSILSTNNYWLQSMWMTADNTAPNTVIFTLKDCIWGGGVRGREGNEKYFNFDINKRIKDIIRIARYALGIDEEITLFLQFYSEIYLGNRNFIYAECEQRLKGIMVFLATKYPDEYSGTSDPLLFIIELTKKCEYTALSLPYHQLIIYGAPGTGKSHTLRQKATELGVDDNHQRRVTFYPTYTYQQFVGTYKPINKNDNITYEFIPGPFLSLLTEAYRHSDEKFLLIIEEINRANASAVFGDVFQLLDRQADDTSEFPIAISQDMKKYFQDEHLERNELTLPSNFYIWATMNSADQGVFPIDTAFKRRWDFKYLNINTNDSRIVDKFFTFKNDRYRWNSIRKAINKLLLRSKVNEDKLIGPFFIKLDNLENEDLFKDAFKSKVLMYLFEDAIRHNRTAIFKSIGNDPISYSDICKRLDENGLTDIFVPAIFEIIDEEEQKQLETERRTTTNDVPAPAVEPPMAAPAVEPPMAVPAVEPPMAVPAMEPPPQN